MDSDASQLYLEYLLFNRENYRDMMFMDIAYSSRKINQQLGNIESAVQETNFKLEQLRQDVNRHLTNINAELVLQSKILTNIENVLQNKRKTEAEELKKFGLYAFQNGWYEEAKEDLLESLKYYKYDYQIYFFLSKVYANLEEPNNQIENINKAFKYGLQDADFLQFVYMDMASICIEKKDYENAKKIVAKSLSIKKSTASCLTSVILDIKLGSVTEDTFENIELAIESYESESPARVIEAIEVISGMVSSEVADKINNIINKCKLNILKRYAGVLYLKIQNLIDVLKQVSQDKRFIVSVVPQYLIQKYFPHFKSVNPLINKLDSLKEKLQKVTIDSYDEVIVLPRLMNYVINNMITYYRLALNFNAEGNIAQNPFSQKYTPFLKISLAANDIILIQVKLDSNRYISLTNEKLIITKEGGLSTIFNITDIDTLELKIINKHETLAYQSDNYRYNTEILTFILQKKDTEQMLLIDKSSVYGQGYGSGTNVANMLNLLWALAQNNSNIINSMIGIDSCVLFADKITESYIDKLSKVQSKINPKEDTVEFISDSDGNDDEVEFVE